MARPFDNARPTVEDLHGDNAWAELARKHWLNEPKVRKVKHDLLKKDVWDVLESESFALRSLLVLENLQILERFAEPSCNLLRELLIVRRFLWPTYDENASNYHVLLIAVIVNIKQREHLPIWGSLQFSLTCLTAC